MRTASRRAGVSFRNVFFVTPVALLLSAGCLAPAARQDAAATRPAELRDGHAKHEFRIPMRDHVKLFTSVYTPRDTSRTCPIMLCRTPYSVAPYGEEAFPDKLGPSPLFSGLGFIFAYQDVRGRFMSEGQFVDMRPHIDHKASPADIDESSDTYDTIDWLVKNVPNNNGRVGMWGISYPGFYVAAGIIDSHPALKAASPQAPIADWFVGDDFHHNGAFFLMDAFHFYYSFGRPRPAPTTTWPARLDYGTPDAYRFYLDMGALPNADKSYMKGDVAFWNEMMRHGTYDEFWKSRNLLPHLHGIHCAVMTVGGWFDAEDLYGPLHIYAAIERENPGIENRLVMGPWSHGGWARTDGDALGDVQFEWKTSQYYQEQAELPFFEHYLEAESDKPYQPPEALVFTSGSNKWHSFDAWPPRDLKPRSLYLRENGRLSFAPPVTDGNDSSAFDEYGSDPARPVPYTNETTSDRGRTYMTEDQRFAARRPDVMVYEAEPQAEDLTLAGPIDANLFVSSTGTDADFVVKLIDEYPNDASDNNPNPRGNHMGGYQALVRGEVMRAKFRKSFEKPEPLTPGEVTPVSFHIQDICHTFKKGHRLMVQVQSSWFPLVDRNPQTFTDIYGATQNDFYKATQRIYRSAGHASHLGVGVRE